MSTPALRRLMRDKRRFKKTKPPGIEVFTAFSNCSASVAAAAPLYTLHCATLASFTRTLRRQAFPSLQSAYEWKAFIYGPDDTAWEGGVFRLTMKFPDEYPNKPPVVKFLTPMFHPNIYEDGKICLDILQNQWSPMYDLTAVLTSIQSLLGDPNPDSPANTVASRLYVEDRTAYAHMVMKYVEKSWGIEKIAEKLETKAEVKASASSATQPAIKRRKLGKTTGSETIGKLDK